MSYSAFGWFDLWVTTDGEGEDDAYGRVEILQRELSEIDWGYLSVVEIRHLNWANVLTIACRQKRPYDLPELLDTLLRRVGELFPGSHGLLYEHDDDLVGDEHGNRYQVRVLIRGVVTIRPDPFFSPLNPTIED